VVRGRTQRRRSGTGQRSSNRKRAGQGRRPAQAKGGKRAAPSQHATMQ
jgi:hypothetical protein